MRCIRLFLLCTSMLLTACAMNRVPVQYAAHVEQSGALECSGQVSVNCELSGVAWVKSTHGGDLIFVNDKTPKSPQESSIFSMPFADGQFDSSGPKTFFTQPIFSSVNKFEAMSVSADGQHVLAMSAFDRYHKDDEKQDKFNVLLAWPATATEKTQVLSNSQRNAVVSSMALRARLEAAVKKHYGPQAQYFKVEGLALMPGSKIVFGVREIGQSFSAFAYKIALLEGRYKQTPAGIALDEAQELVLVRDFSDGQVSLGHTVGVSSLEYDPQRQILYVLTSFEDQSPERVGAYLWVLSAVEGSLGTQLTQVQDAEGKPFKFSGKAEGLALLGDGRLFIVHDDDRYDTQIKVGTGSNTVERPRKNNEASFQILRLQATQPSQP